MENIGIDLGTSKTILTSSRNNGCILFDNLGSRSIKSILELTSPLRKFGNNVLEPKRKDLNKRKRITVTDHENLFYYINYLNKLTNASSFTLTVPYFLSYKERYQIYNLCKSSKMNVNIVNDITAFGMFYALKCEQCEERFAVLDCGHSKTTFGLFEKKDNEIKPLMIKGLQIGGRDFDSRILEFVMKKHNIEERFDSLDFVKEKILLQLDKLKSSLNSIDEYRFSFEVLDEMVVIDITKEEYLSVIKEDLKKMNDFFMQIKNEIGETSVAVVGGNCFNLNVREILESNFVCNYAMDAFESGSFGACFMGTIMKFGSRANHKVNDLFFEDLYIRMYEREEEREGKKCTKVFGHKTVPFEGSKVSYTRKDDFSFDLLTESGLVLTGRVSEIKESVDLAIRISKNGIIEVEAVNGKVEIEEPDFSVFVENEEKMRNAEEEFVMCGTMRNELEHVLMNLRVEELSDEQKEILREVKDSLVFYPMCERISDEQKIRDEVCGKIEFIVEMVKEKIKRVREMYDTCFESFESLMREKKKFSHIKTSYKLQGIIYSKKEILRKMEANIYNATWILNMKPEEEIKEIESLKSQCEREIKEKEEEEKKRMEEEEKKRVEEEKKKAEEEEKKEKSEDSKPEQEVKEEL